MIAAIPIPNSRLHLSALSLAVVALPYSIGVCHCAFILYIILWLTERNWSEKIAIIKKSVVLQLFFLFAVLLFAGMLYSENKTEGWLSLEKKIFFFIMPLVLATSIVKFTRNEIRIIFYLFIVTCFVATIICLAKAIIQVNQPVEVTVVPESPWLFFSYQELAGGIGIHPAYLAFYLAFCILLLFSDFSTIRSTHTTFKVGAGFLIVYFSIFIVCLASRVIIFSLLSVLVGMIIFRFSNSIKRKKTYTILFLVLVCLATLYINPVSRYKNLQEVGQTSFLNPENTSPQTATQIRLSLLWIGWKSLAKINLVTGIGTGDVEKLMHETSDEYGITNIHNTYDPHNGYLSILLALGLTGLVVFIACLVVPFGMAFHQRDHLLMGFIFLFSTFCFSENVLGRQKSVAFFALFFPVLAFCRQAFQSSSSTSKILSAQN